MTKRQARFCERDLGGSPDHDPFVGDDTGDEENLDVHDDLVFVSRFGSSGLARFRRAVGLRLWRASRGRDDH